MIIIGIAVVSLMIASRWTKKRSIKMERLFIHNLRSRDIMAQVNGEKKPLYEGHLLDRDIHISDFDVPEDSSWGGKTLKELHLRERFGVDMSSIMRGSQRLNIPNGDTVISQEINYKSLVMMTNCRNLQPRSVRISYQKIWK